MSIKNNNNIENEAFLEYLVKELSTVRSGSKTLESQSSKSLSNDKEQDKDLGIDKNKNIKQKKSEFALKTQEWVKLAKSDKLDIEQRLFIAILLNSKETVADLLAVGANPNALNPKQTTPLQLALAFGRIEIAKLLSDYGALPSFSPNTFKF